MSAPTEVELEILCAVLIVLFHGYLCRRIWNYPLSHGPGFFLGVAVSPDFYDGPGTRWMKGYHAMLVTVYTMIALGLFAIIVSGQWDKTPLWAGGSAPVFVGGQMGFIAWTRRKLGASPPVLRGVAVALETRRLGDYISWPMEALVAGIVGASWLLLLFSHAGFGWQIPITTTWIVLGMLPGKIILVRNSFPLPPERTEEHYRLSEATRRWSLRVMEVFRWGCVVPLAIYALKHSWVAAQGVVWLNWTFVGVALVPYLVLIDLLTRGQMRLAAMGRDLRPAGSWSAPFRPARLMLRGGITWFATWFGGLMLLLIFFQD